MKTLKELKKDCFREWREYAGGGIKLNYQPRSKRWNDPDRFFYNIGGGTRKGTYTVQEFKKTYLYEQLKADAL
jgi:hypothetical protein